MDILLTGGSGQVGIELGRLEWPASARLHAPDRAALDLADPTALREALRSRRWAAVISCGAYTAVDRAETDVDAAWAINARAPGVLAEEAARAGIPLVHVSTDYVFDGSKGRPYHEGDAVAPLNVYGASKEAGEAAIRAAGGRHAILRTAWLVSPHRSNFVLTMLRLARETGEVRVVEDQRGCPTTAGDLAAALKAVALRLITDSAFPGGTYHCVNAGEASWADFAQTVFAVSKRGGGPSAGVVRITSAERPTPARRPLDTRLSTARLERDFAVRLRPWHEAVEELVAVLV